MARILAIDYGSKRVGIAITDPLQMIAHGLKTVSAKDIISFIKAYIEKEEVECFVVGDPKNLDNTPSESAGLVERFINELQKEFPEIPVKKVDERFTSKMAFQTMIDSGLKKKKRRDKALVDEISATIILQSYLEMNSTK